MKQASELGGLFSSMGNTADEVAVTLRTAKVQGVRNAVRFLNPIVRYCQGYLLADDYTLDVMQRGLLRVQVQGVTHQLPLSPPMIDFLDAFNTGAYPDLELAMKD